MVPAFQFSQPASTSTPATTSSISQPAPLPPNALLPISPMPHMEMVYSMLAFTILIKVVLGAVHPPTK
jgi:hypothetical protein